MSTMAADFATIPINHVDAVNAYYASFRLKASSVKVPHEPYVKVSSNPKKKKRKRQEINKKVVLPPSDLLRQLDAARIKCLGERLVPEYLGKCTEDSNDAGECGESGGYLDAMTDWYTNLEDKEEMFMHGSLQCIVPRKSTFFLGNVFQMPRVLQRFHLIVMDPPWENKTVARASAYGTMPHTHLAKIDVPAIADPHCAILAMWVTNKPAFTAYIMEELLPLWGFEYCQTWYWNKVCMSGEFVTPLESTHKLPFERLIIATRGTVCKVIPPKVLVSIPHRHSWRPPLEELFQDHLPKESTKVELFARELRPGWTSVGNEVVKFQNMNLFELTN